MNLPKIVGKANTEHFTWGHASDAWHFLQRDDLSVILEEVPPGESETAHFHKQSRQFFYVLSGTATFEIGDETITVHADEGLEIEPGIPHRFYNPTNEKVRFIAISMPKSHGDRFESQ